MIQNCSGAKELQFVDNQKLNIYPNPVNMGDTITILGIESDEVSISDISGKVQLVTKVKNGDEIDISSLTTGVYFVTTSNKTLKLVIK